MLLHSCSPPLLSLVFFSVVKHTNGTLAFYPVNRGDTGLYTCIAYNAAATRIHDTVLYVTGQFSGGLPNSVIPECLPVQCIH